MNKLILLFCLTLASSAHAKQLAVQAEVIRNGAGSLAVPSSGSASITGVNTGDLTLSTTNGLSLSGQALSLGLSSAGTTGALSSANWSLFNAKQPAGNYTTALTGDVSATGPGSASAVVNSVGGSSAANINSAELAANAATSANTPSTIVKRGASGELAAGAVTSASTVKAGNPGTTSFEIVVGSGAAGPGNMEIGSADNSQHYLSIKNSVSETLLWTERDGNWPDGSANLAAIGTGAALNMAAGINPANGEGAYSFQITKQGSTIIGRGAGSSGGFYDLTVFDPTSLYVHKPDVVSLKVAGVASQTANILEVHPGNATDSSLPIMSVGPDGLLTMHNSHFKSTQTTAPTTTVNANAGTGATCSVSRATDQAGLITLVSGSALTAPGVQCDVNFNAAYGTAPVCVFSAADTATALVSVAPAVEATPSAASLSFGLGAGLLTTYKYLYHCVETQ